MHENQALIEDVIRLHGAHDIDGIMSRFADDVIYEDVPMERRSVGHAGARALWQEVYQQFPDYSLQLVTAFANDARGGVEFVQIGTHLGEGFGYPITGKPIAIRTAAVIEFRDGLVSAWRDYWSENMFLKQVGLA